MPWERGMHCRAAFVEALPTTRQFLEMSKHNDPSTFNI
jgi:hypothetical protein